MVKRTAIATALVAGLIVQSQSFAQLATAGTNGIAASAAESVAHANWRLFLAKNPASEAGCSHVSYPNAVRL